MYKLLELSELPIVELEGVVRFIVPIHTALLDLRISLDPNLAISLFDEAKEKAKLRLTKKNQKVLEKICDNPTVQKDSRGFASNLSYSESSTSGSLFFDRTKPYRVSFYRGLYTGSIDKLNSYRNLNLLWGYDMHNVDSVVQATMLQTWAILYLNKALESLE